MAIPLSMLDTDVVADIQRGYPPAVNWLGMLDASDIQNISVPGYVVMETIQGARNKREAESAQRILRRFPRVWPSATACEAALADFQTLYLSHSLGLIDALIAATAREMGAQLYTFNAKHYRAVPGLAIDKPYQR